MVTNKHLGTVEGHTIKNKNKIEKLIHLIQVFLLARIFGNDASQNYLLFKSMTKYFKMKSNGSILLKWESKGLPNEIKTSRH